MKFTLTINTDNDDNGPDMVADELERVAAQVLDGFTSGRLQDGNGNHAGDWEMTE